MIFARPKASKDLRSAGTETVSTATSFFGMPGHQSLWGTYSTGIGGIGGSSPIPGRKQDAFGIGYYCVGYSDDFKDIARLAIPLRDEVIAAYRAIVKRPYGLVVKAATFADASRATR